MAVLPHYSPGYPEWAIDEQPRLLDLINRSRQRMPPVPVEVLESGMLRPKKSLLAVFGVTRHVERVQRLTDLIPCDNCSFLTCQYRRTPYRRAPEPVNPELSALGGDRVAVDAPRVIPLNRAASYTVNVKALQRWSDERLSMEQRADGTIDAVFRYEGTTCTNMGRPLQFQYRVTLGPREEGYPIREQQCAPATATPAPWRLGRWCRPRGNRTLSQNGAALAHTNRGHASVGLASNGRAEFLPTPTQTAAARSARGGRWFLVPGSRSLVGNQSLPPVVTQGRARTRYGEPQTMDPEPGTARHAVHRRCTSPSRGGRRRRWSDGRRAAGDHSS